MRITTLGSYPKIPYDNGPNVRSAIQRFERKSIGPFELDQVFLRRTRHVLQVAEQNELDLTSDGLIRWNDMFDGVVRDFDNVSSAGLLRLFDNNFYYRHPLIRGRLSFQGGVVRWWLKEAVASSKVPIKAVLPGPFTFLKLSQDDSYHNSDALLEDLVEVLRLEALSLADVGIAEVQWDEPALAYYPDWNMTKVAATLAQLTAQQPLPQALALYWGNGVGRWLQPLSGVGFSRLYLDAVSDPGVVSTITNNPPACEVGLGLVDARQVKKESVDELARQLQPIVRRLGESNVWLHPSSGLELLPPDHAEAKVRILRDVRDTIRGSSGNGGLG